MTQIKTPHDLDGIALLTPLDADARTALATRCAWRAYAKGEQILSRNDEGGPHDGPNDGGGVYFVIDGAVGIVNYSLNGREIAYSTVDTGGYFGELAAIDGAPRSATVIAKSACALAVLPAAVFLTLLREEPDVALAVLRKLAGIIRRGDDRIMDLSTLGTQARVCRELLRLAEEEGGTAGTAITTLPTQSDIANMTGTTRETVARTLGQLTTGGLIDRQGRQLTIIDREALEDVADQWSE